MKKVILSAIAVVTFTVLSQAQVKVGIVAGGNLSNLQGAGVGSKLISTNAFRGYHAGLVADVQVLNHIYLQPKVLFTHTGAKYTDCNNGAATKLVMNSIEVPLNILYKADLPFGKVFAGAGPVISYGFTGKQEQSGQSTKLYSAQMKNWKRIGIGANVLAGFEFNNGLFASAGYQMGLKDMYKTDANIKNRALSVSVGYLVDVNKLIRKG